MLSNVVLQTAKVSQASFYHEFDSVSVKFQISNEGHIHLISSNDDIVLQLAKASGVDSIWSKCTNCGWVGWM